MKSKLKTASEKCVNNYGFFIGATPDNVSDLQDAVGTPTPPSPSPAFAVSRSSWVPPQGRCW